MDFCGANEESEYSWRNVGNPNSNYGNQNPNFRGQNILKNQCFDEQIIARYMKGLNDLVGSNVSKGFTSEPMDFYLAGENSLIDTNDGKKGQQVVQISDVLGNSDNVSTNSARQGSRAL